MEAARDPLYFHAKIRNFCYESSSAMLNCKTRHDYILYLEVSENVFPPSSLCHTIPLPIWRCHVILTLSVQHLIDFFPQYTFQWGSIKRQGEGAACSCSRKLPPPLILFTFSRAQTYHNPPVLQHVYASLTKRQVKMAGSIDLILFRVSLWTVTELRFINTQKTERGLYPATLPS